MTADPTRRLMLGCKRAFDLVAASVLVVVLAPVMIAIAIAVVIGSPGPPVFVQSRAGRYGHPFRIYKFRSMVPRAEDGGPVLSMGDSRVTPVGRFLRRTSLDELPQLINVLRGDMSLVGPRPQLIGTTRPGEERRFDMRPGITGFWQVTARARTTFREALEMDVAYARSWTLGLDILLLLKTPFHLKRGTA